METVRSRWPDERELLSRVCAQDLQAFERLYRMYRPRLARFLMGMLQRPQLIEEVLDDTMMVVWQSAGNFRGSSKPSTWIFAIAYRKALKAKARWPQPVEDEEFDSRVSPDPGPDQQLHHQRLPQPADPRTPHRAGIPHHGSGDGCRLDEVAQPD